MVLVRNLSDSVWSCYVRSDGRHVSAQDNRWSIGVFRRQFHVSVSVVACDCQVVVQELAVLDKKLNDKTMELPQAA